MVESGMMESDMMESDMRDATSDTFFLPGPTEVRPEVLHAMARPMIPHRGAEFRQLFERVQRGLRHVFRTTRPVIVNPSSATGLMEAAVRCAPPGPILALVNGAFAARFARIARLCDRETDVVELPWGAAVDPDVAIRALAGRRYAAVTVVHSETSTGALTDVRSIQAVAREHGALCLVDSVSGVGGAPLEADAWELDLVLTGSQKALAMPPGMAFAVASAEYLHRAESAPGRGMYFDLVELHRRAEESETLTTPPLSLLYAADRQLRRVEGEGMERRWERHAAMAHTIWEWAEESGAGLSPRMRILAPPGTRSPTVSTVELPGSVCPSDLVRAVSTRGYVIGGGYGKLAGSTIRVGHMGEHTTAGLTRCLAAVADALEELLPRPGGRDRG